MSLCLIWGFSWVAIKFSLEGIPRFLGAGLRFLVAVPLLYLYLRIRRIPLVIPGQVYALVFITEVLIYILPIVAALSEWFIYGELIAMNTVIGMILIFLGIAIAELPKYRSLSARRAQ